VASKRPIIQAPQKVNPFRNSIGFQPVGLLFPNMRALRNYFSLSDYENAAECPALWGVSLYGFSIIFEPFGIRIIVP
jgi:hypothetical protein